MKLRIHTEKSNKRFNHKRYIKLKKINYELTLPDYNSYITIIKNFEKCNIWFKLSKANIIDILIENDNKNDNNDKIAIHYYNNGIKFIKYNDNSWIVLANVGYNKIIQFIEDYTKTDISNLTNGLLNYVDDDVIRYWS